MSPTTRAIFYLIAGLALLGLVWLPRRRAGKAVGVPLIYLLVGMILFAGPLLGRHPDPMGTPIDAAITELATELIVIISLVASGLSIDQPPGLRRWSLTWRLLGIAMPLTIAGLIAAAVMILGLSLPEAILLAACLSPTDPVLARSVQVAPPNRGGEDPVRFGLTSEAGLNDGLAFPFVYLALAAAAHAGDGLPVGPWLARWFAIDLVYGVVVGAGLGWLVGSVVARRVLGGPEAQKPKDTNEGLIILGATFLAYGGGEIVGGYGFLAAFVAGVAARHVEAKHHYHALPHHFAAQSEKILLGLILILLGGAALSFGHRLLAWPVMLFAGLALLVIRPAAAWLSMIGSPVGPRQRGMIAVFGIRGLGTIYYLSYAHNQDDFDAPPALWAAAVTTVLASIALHGLTVRPALRAASRNQAEHDQLPDDE